MLIKKNTRTNLKYFFKFLKSCQVSKLSQEEVQVFLKDSPSFQNLTKISLPKDSLEQPYVRL